MEKQSKPASESSHSPTEQPGDAKHTPGLWKFRHHETGADEIYTDDREATIALVYSGGVWASEVGLNDKNAVKYANAELISRAPALLSEVSTLRSKQAELVEENARLKAECSSHEKERYEIYSFDSSQAMEIKALQKELEQLRSERDKMREENERLKQELQDEKDYLHGIIKQTEQDAAREIDKYRP